MDHKRMTDGKHFIVFQFILGYILIALGITGYDALTNPIKSVSAEIGKVRVQLQKIDDIDSRLKKIEEVIRVK